MIFPFSQTIDSGYTGGESEVYQHYVLEQNKKVLYLSKLQLYHIKVGCKWI